MSCSGLHCAGCAGGSAAPALGLAAFLGVDWVVTHIIEVAVVSGTCGALAIAAVVWLMRLGERRDARRAATWRLLYTREVPVISDSPIRPALGFRDLHIHLDGLAAEQAQVIRQALNGRTDQS